MKILVTRPLYDSLNLVFFLKKLGYCAWSMPLIEFYPGKDLLFVSKKINLLRNGDLIFILSKNCIYFIKKTMNKKKLIWPKFLNYYAIGKNTASLMNINARVLTKYPKKEDSENLINMNSLKNIVGKKALVLCGNKTREILNNFLKKKGVEIIHCECYKTINKIYNGNIEGKKWLRLGVNTIIVTSESMLKRLYFLFPNFYRKKWLLLCKLIVISNRLAIIARGLGWKKILISEKADNFSILKIFY